MTPELATTVAAGAVQPNRAWVRIGLLAIAAAALGAAINIREGLYHLAAIRWLDLALIATVLAVAWRGPAVCGRLVRRVAIIVLLLALLFEFLLLYFSYPKALWNTRHNEIRYELSHLKDTAPYMPDPLLRSRADARMREIEADLDNPVFKGAVLIAAALAATSLARVRWVRAVAFPMLLAFHFVMGVGIIHSSPSPHIDVYVFQQESCRGLLRGENPYALRFPNIYGPSAFVYGPGLKTEDRVNFGFPYPPLSLYMALPGYVLMGDHRYSQLAAVTLAAALMAYGHAGLIARVAAMLYLFTPRVFTVIELGWTEPFVVLLLAATVFCAIRLPRLTPYALGLLLASKQYLVFVIPVAALLLQPPFDWRRYGVMLAKAAGLAVIISFPLVLWNVGEFIHSAIKLQFQQPLRKDSISQLAWLAWRYSEGAARALEWLAFAAVIPAIVLAVRRCPRNPAGFANAVALIYVLFFAFNKQAFCNYYFFVIGALCCAISATHLPDFSGGDDATIQAVPEAGALVAGQPP